MNAGLALFTFLVICTASALAGFGVDNMRYESRKTTAAWLFWFSGFAFGGIAMCFLQWLSTVRLT